MGTCVAYGSSKKEEVERLRLYLVVNGENVALMRKRGRPVDPFHDPRLFHSVLIDENNKIKSLLIAVDWRLSQRDLRYLREGLTHNNNKVTKLEIHLPFDFHVLHAILSDSRCHVMKISLHVRALGWIKVLGELKAILQDPQCKIQCLELFGKELYEGKGISLEELLGCNGNKVTKLRLEGPRLEYDVAFYHPVGDVSQVANVTWLVNALLHPNCCVRELQCSFMDFRQCDFVPFLRMLQDNACRIQTLNLDYTTMNDQSFAEILDAARFSSIRSIFYPGWYNGQGYEGIEYDPQLVAKLKVLNSRSLANIIVMLAFHSYPRLNKQNKPCLPPEILRQVYPNMIDLTKAIVIEPFVRRFDLADRRHNDGYFPFELGLL